MGPEPPPPMTKLGPRQMKQVLNASRAYGIATHLESWLFDQTQNEFLNLPSGVLVKTKRVALFYAEYELVPVTETLEFEVSDQLASSVDPSNPPNYIPVADLTSSARRGTILGGFFSVGFGSPVPMRVFFDGSLVSFEGSTTITVSEGVDQTLAADADQRVVSSLVFEFGTPGLPTGINDQGFIAVWGVMP